jgi:hypothetical protein
MHDTLLLPQNNEIRQQAYTGQMPQALPDAPMPGKDKVLRPFS